MREHSTERDYTVQHPKRLDDIIDDGRWLLVEYECTCGEEWSDEWSCACDDECPSCGTVMEAKDWTDITATRAADLADCLCYRCVGSDELVETLRWGEPTEDDLALAGALLRGEVAK